MIAACRDAELVPEIFGTFAPSAAARFEREKSRRPGQPTSRNTHKSQNAIKLREEEEEERAERRKKILDLHVRVTRVYRAKSPNIINR